MAEEKQTVYYNSWIPAYKRPYGAVQAGSAVTFTIDGGKLPVTYAALRIHKDYGNYYEKAMHQIKDTNRYTVTFDLSEGNGLYFYSFKVVHKGEGSEQVLYYGNNEGMLGGEGKVYYEDEDVKPYQLTAYAFDDPAPEWYRSGVAYHIFVDRFRNGNPDGSVSNPKEDAFIYSSDQDIPYYVKNEKGEVVRWDFFGGNLKGIIEKLPYLEDMGVSILYLSPIFEARSNHKYDTGDYFKIDPMFGDEEDFDALIEEAENRGIHVLLDGVFNHVGADSRYFNRFGTYSDTGAYQSPDSPYKDWFIFHSYPDDYEAWWGVKDLPKLNTEQEGVQRFIFKDRKSVVRHWTRKGIGGWRLDVADELSDDFLAGIRDAMESSALIDPVLVGEVWEDATNKIAYDQRRHYLEGGILHGAMNYPFRNIIIDLLNGRITVGQAVEKWLNLKENYPPAAFYSNLNNIGSHDTARIRTALQKSDEKVWLAMLLLFSLPGVPCVYYGDEAGLEGGTDPDNRRMYPWEQEDKQLVSFVKNLMHWRHEEVALQKGTFYPFAASDVFGMVRLEEENWVVVLLNPTTEAVTLRSEEVMDKTDLDISSFLQDKEIDELTIPSMSFRVFASDDQGETVEQTDHLQREVEYPVNR